MPRTLTMGSGSWALMTLTRGWSPSLCFLGGLALTPRWALAGAPAGTCACRDATKLVRYAVRFAGEALAVHNDVLRCLAETSLALIIPARYYEARNTRNHVERIARGELREICRIEGPRGAARSVRDRRRILCRSRILGEGGRCDAAGDDDGGSSKQQSVQTHEDCPITLKLDFAFTYVGETA
mgnify:CR=1 FL=1